jgi:hypothetical protein
MLKINGKEYLVGPVSSLGAPRAWDDTGIRVFHCNQNCTVLRRSDDKRLMVKVQHLNTQWPSYYPLRTQAEILSDWS